MGLFTKDIQTMDDLLLHGGRPAASRPEGRLLRREPDREIATKSDRQCGLLLWLLGIPIPIIPVDLVYSEGCTNTSRSDVSRRRLRQASARSSSGTAPVAAGCEDGDGRSSEDGDMVGSPRRDGQQLVAAQGRAARGGARLLFGVFARSADRHRDLDCRLGVRPRGRARRGRGRHTGTARRHRCTGGRGHAQGSRPAARGDGRHDPRPGNAAVRRYRRRRPAQGRVQHGLGGRTLRLERVSGGLPAPTCYRSPASLRSAFCC